MSDRSQDSTRKHVVVLVHGIRDFALWQKTVGSTLQRHGLPVEAINYGRFNLLQFLAPFPLFRKRAIATVWKQIRIIEQNNENSAISVIAHSFGTYVIANLMRQEFDIRFHRVIFCGSVVPFHFPFEQIQGRFSPPIINEVGTRDIWPAIAESMTGGYGSAGTYGFRRPLVVDRWHNGAHHAYFLNSEFCKEFWVPFLKDGIITPGADPPEKAKAWLQLISIVKLKYLFAVVALMMFIYAAYQWQTPTHIPVPNPNSGISIEELKTALKTLEIKKAHLNVSQIRQISSDLTNSLVRSNSTIDRIKRRSMNELIVATLVDLNNHDLSFAWRDLPENLDLTEVNLSGVNLRGVRFKNAFLIFTNLTDSQLDDAIFDNARVRNVDFSGASLSAVIFDKTDWFNALNLPIDPKDGLPLPYYKWESCPADYRSADQHGFINLLEKWYIILFRQLDKDEKDDLVEAWKSYVAGGICDLAQAK